MTDFRFRVAAWFVVAPFVVGLAACSKSEGIANPTNTTSSSQALTSSEIQTLMSQVFGPIGQQAVKSSSSSTGTRSVAGAAQMPQLLVRPVTVQINQPVNETTTCAAGGSVHTTGAASGTYNTDTDLGNITGTMLISHLNCSYQQGTTVQGDPYLTSNMTYTMTGGAWTLRLTLSGGLAYTLAGRGVTRMQTDAAGLSLTQSNTSPCRLQGSVTFSPGGSQSIAQSCS